MISSYPSPLTTQAEAERHKRSPSAFPVILKPVVVGSRVVAERLMSVIIDLGPP